jgi:hypothetical protein
MSIDREIMARLDEKPPRLFEVLPKLPTASQLRFMFVTPEIWSLLVGPWSNEKQEMRWAKLKADLDHFVEGGLINQGYMKPLRKRSDEIWEIRSREPSPSIRVFGRFASVDVFIATTWEERWFLELFDQWRRYKRRCGAQWRQLFSNYGPHRGATIHDYISQNAHHDYADW